MKNGDVELVRWALAHGHAPTGDVDVAALFEVKSHSYAIDRFFDLLAQLAAFRSLLPAIDWTSATVKVMSADVNLPLVQAVVARICNRAGLDPPIAVVL